MVLASDRADCSYRDRLLARVNLPTAVDFTGSIHPGRPIFKASNQLHPPIQREQRAFIEREHLALTVLVFHLFLIRVPSSRRLTRDDTERSIRLLLIAPKSTGRSPHLNFPRLDPFADSGWAFRAREARNP